MPRRPALFTKTDLARAIRTARAVFLQEGGSVEIAPDGTIRIVFPASTPGPPTDAVDWPDGIVP